MKGLFCDGRKAKTNEEYLQILKKRQRWMYGLLAAGLLTMALSVILNMLLKEQVSTRQTCFIMGLGTGLSLGSVIEIWRLRRIMGNEERLKQGRLKEVDEREIEVRSRALLATAKMMLVIIYILGVIGGLFIEELVEICLLLSCIFLFSYMLFQKYYGKKL